MPETAKPHFRPAFFKFLRDLQANNDRAWFQANKSRYEAEVKQPAQAFISDFGPRLRKISRHFVADPRPVGGSLFRIYRDVRFSKDKSPYKTNCAMQFRHRQAKDIHAPGYYLSLSPGEVYVGAGIYHPDGKALQRIRAAIAGDPARWRRILRAPAFAERFELGGESLKRAPKGFDPDHPLIEDLRRKDFFGATQLTRKAVYAADFVDDYARLCRAASPLVRFLCEAVGAPF